jgi:hypothetical protein
MRKSPWIVSIALIFVFAQLAEAQFGGAGGPRFFTEFKPVVGGWAEYQFTGKDLPTKMRIAIVGKEGDAYWYESQMESKKHGKTTSKMLVAGDPTDMKNVKRMIVKEGEKPATEMPTEMMSMFGGKKGQGSKGKLVEMGAETVTVPAGNFKTQRMRYTEDKIVIDMWVSKDIPPYGLVKTTMKDGDMVLLAYGKGAKTTITETPKKFEMPKLPGGGGLFKPKGE